MNERPISVAIAKAREILNHWSITEPREINVEDIASEMCLLVTEQEISGAVAKLVCTSEVGVICVKAGIREPSKKRFAIAHEIGHFVLHKVRERIAFCTDKDFQDWYSHSPDESEANAFAAELLMPAEMFRQRCTAKEPSLTEITELADDFQTSLSATAIRYVEVGKHPCAIVASKDGKIFWMSISKSFPHRILPRGTKLHEYSCANDFFATGKVPKVAQSVSGVAWLENLEVAKNCFVYEEVIPLTSYNVVLSLIWVQQDYYKPRDASYEQPDYDPEKFTPDGKRYRW
jgi:Zn-dependent peptidase ImmA (M78 family)